MNYGKKSTQKREKELTSKSTMIRKKFYVIFCKSLLVCVFVFIGSQVNEYPAKQDVKCNSTNS